MIIKKAPKWNEILEKPENFPPSPHQHGDSDLLGIDWSKVQNKPSANEFEVVYEVKDLETSSMTIDLTDVNMDDYKYFVYFAYVSAGTSSDTHGLYINGNSYTDSIYGVNLNQAINKDYTTIGGDVHSPAHKSDYVNFIVNTVKGGVSYGVILHQSNLIYREYVFNREDYTYYDDWWEVERVLFYLNLPEPWTTFGTISINYFTHIDYFVLWGMRK